MNASHYKIRIVTSQMLIHADYRLLQHHHPCHAYDGSLHITFTFMPCTGQYDYMKDFGSYEGCVTK